MNWFDFALFGVTSFAAQHLVPFGLFALVLIVALSVVFFGTGPAVLAFLRSRVGQIIIALVVAGIVGWELKGFVDDAVTLRRQIVDEREKAARDLAEEKARTALASAMAAQERKSAEDQRAVAESAAARAEAAAGRAADLEEEKDDYADALDDAQKHPPSGPVPGRCPLSAADAGRLRALGTATGRRAR